MRIRKSDWTIVREAEERGLMVAMTNFVHGSRTDLNNVLGDYFRKQMPNYTGVFDEYTGEDILYSINEYLLENNINKQPLDFPFSSGTDIHLIPINENIQLKVTVADEYYGDGEYSKYVKVDYFLINEKTTEKDVDELVEFVKENLSNV